MAADESKENEASYGYVAEGNDLEEENKILKETVNHLQEELKRHRTPPLLVGEVKEVDKDGAVVKLKNANEFFVSVSSQVKGLKSGDTVLCDQKNLTIIAIIDQTKQFDVEKFVNMIKPTIKWKDVGGLAHEINEIQEVVELPLKKPELFEKIGITPPKGILLYGPPGTGKTLLAKAVAASTKSTFIEIVGSELVQKFIGEGAKLIKEIFQLAREKAPSIIFIDELDALAATRIEIGTSGEREVQRTFMQLLAEIDGFKNLGNVKVIGATNRKDILDPAILRPGRLDRQIMIDNPSKEGIKQIFKIHSASMKMEKMKKEKIHEKMEGMSGAEIKAVCTEAGYFAIRQNRTKVKQKDFMEAIQKVKADEELQEHIGMFG